MHNNLDKIITVELSTPLDDRSLDALDSTISKLLDAGIKSISIPDKPLGKAHLDSVSLSTYIKQKYGISPLTHINARDRNKLALEASLLSLSTFGLNKVLLINGDPIAETYSFNEKLTTLDFIKFVKSLGTEDNFSREFKITAALDTSKTNFESELAYAREKITAGADSFMTQIITSEQNLQNLAKARAGLPQDIKIIAGIYPLLNLEHALHLNANAPGIDIPAETIRRFADIDPVELAIEQVNKALTHADGVYIVIPKNGLELILEVIKRISD